MTPSTKWVNPKLKAYPHRSRVRRRNDGYHAILKENGNGNGSSQSKKTNRSEKVNRELTSQSDQGQPSLLETLSTLSTLSQKIDWAKIRHQVDEINQVVEQVNGVFKQLNGWNQHPSYKNEYRQYPYYPQHPYATKYPYDPYRQGQ
jgi:hypothetical protein